MMKMTMRPRTKTTTRNKRLPGAIHSAIRSRIHSAIRSRIHSSALILAVAALLLPAALLVNIAVPHLLAQTSLKQRTVDGKVISKAEAPLPGSVVFLKDTKSLNVKTYICDEDGHFHFGQLSQNTDYDLWATSNGIKSNTKTISSFDDKNSYYFTLTVPNTK